jgi:hypothetical protein
MKMQKVPPLSNSRCPFSTSIIAAISIATIISAAIVITVAVVIITAIIAPVITLSTSSSFC